MTIRIHAGTRSAALRLFARIKKELPDVWKQIIGKVGNPPTGQTGLRGFDLNGSSLGLSSSFSLSSSGGSASTVGDSWLSSAANAATQLLSAYGTFKNTTAQNKLQLEQLRAKTEALRAASTPAATPLVPTPGDAVAQPADATPSKSSNGLLIGVAAAAALGLVVALKR